MKALTGLTVAGLALIGSMGLASAQYYGDRDRGGPRYDDRDRGYDRRGGGDRYDDRRGGGGRSAGFDEREYLRCNPDVRRAVQNGQMESAIVHYQRHGQREGRRLSC